MAANEKITYPKDPVRVRAFARFFKNYMSISTLVTASLPIPISAISLIPIFDAQRHMLATYSSLFCFLVLAFVFYARHTIARILFVDTSKSEISVRTDFHISIKSIVNWRIFHRFIVTMLPAILVGGSIYCVYSYHRELDFSLHIGRADFPSASAKEILEQVQIDEIQNGALLMTYYIGFFVLAEAAFVLMAIKEYLQDLLELTEKDLILGNTAK